jgi:hypothetical protein
MNRLARITALSATIDTTLNEFALAANAQGEYPWQQAQRERRNRRVAGAAEGAAAIVAGAYGAKKGHEAIMKRGLPGLQDAAGGPVRTADAYKSVAKEGVDKLKGAVGGTRVGQYGKNLAGGYQRARKGAMIMGKPTGGKGVIGAGLAALRKVKFSRADQIIALEAKMDEALVEFGMGTTGSVIGAASSATKKKEGENTPEYLQRTAKGAVKGAVIGKSAEVGLRLAHAVAMKKLVGKLFDAR